MLLVPEAAPEAALPAGQWKELAHLPLCLLTPNMQNRQVVNSAFRRAAVQPYVVVETDSMTALLAHVRQAGLYSVVPHSLLGFPAPPLGTRMLPLTPEFTRGIGLITLVQDPPAPLPSAILGIAETLDLQGLFDVASTAPRQPVSDIR
jgi:DNA-binding transcriptional LysR family regulator